MTDTTCVRKDMRILIVGGGFAAPTVALMLARRGFSNIKFIEHQEECEDNGYGVGLAGSGHRILYELDLPLDTAETRRQVHLLKLHNEKGEEIESVGIDLPGEAYDSFAISCKDLHELLDAAIANESVTIERERRLNDIELKLDGSAIAIYDNREREDFDMVIDGSGISSKIREKLYDLSSRGVSPWSMWWFWGTGDYTSEDIMTYSAEGVSIAHISLGDGRHFFSVFTYDTPEKILNGSCCEKRIYLKSFLSQFSNLPPVISQSFEEADEYRGKRITRVKVKKSFCHNCILIGDAEHGFSPLLGMGTALALEDALVLAEELAAAVEAGLPVATAYKRYDKRREPRISYMQWSNDFLSPMLTRGRPGDRAMQKMVTWMLPEWMLEKLFQSMMKWRV